MLWIPAAMQTLFHDIGLAPSVTNGGSIASYNHFIQLFRRVFNHSPEGKEVSGRLLTLKQGSRRAAEFALDFRTIAAESGWNESALKAVFPTGIES